MFIVTVQFMKGSAISNDTIRVLLVDDETDFTSTLSKRLNRRGMAVSTADDGIEAYSMLGRTPFDVVVLDMHMPGLNGLQTLKAIKKGFNGVEIIMLSGGSDMRDALHSANAGAFDFLLKPTKTETLSRKIHEAVATART